jgi:hypothetical protein
MSIMMKHLKSQFLNVSQQQNNPPQILSWSADSTMGCAPLTPIQVIRLYFLLGWLMVMI